MAVELSGALSVGGSNDASPLPTVTMDNVPKVPPGYTLCVNSKGRVYLKRSSGRRRKQLFLSKDLAQISALIGILGKGQLASSIISSAIARR